MQKRIWRGKVEEAKFILSKKIVLEQFEKLKELTPLISYSSKTNQYVTKILEEKTDSMFSVHFENELIHVKDKTKVVFLAQAWDNKQIKRLLDMGISWFIVDNQSDLEIIKEYLQKNVLNKKINLFLRIKLKERTLKTERYFVFGMPSRIVNEQIAKIRGDNKINSNLEGLGIHFHRKTQNMSEWDLDYELTNIINPGTFDTIDFINIGGGLPSYYANTNVNVVDGVFEKLKKLREFLKEKNIQMIIEPGRFIAAPAGELITKIIGIDDGNIVVNASVYNTDMDAVIVPVKLLIKGEVTKEEGKQFVVKGMTPCSMDLFRYRVYLNEPKVGDEMIFLNAGAYNFTTDFCDLAKLKTEVVE
jgi:ornithine decarboxylase